MKELLLQNVSYEYIDGVLTFSGNTETGENGAKVSAHKFAAGLPHLRAAYQTGNVVYLTIEGGVTQGLKFRDDEGAEIFLERFVNAMADFYTGDIASIDAEGDDGE